MSLESAKKYGYTASMINIILPVIGIIVALGLFAALFHQILVNPTIDLFSTFLGGALIGTSIIMGAAGISALILFLLAMHKLANYYKEPAIFRNILYGLLLTTIGAIITSIISAIITTTTLITTTNPTMQLPIENNFSTITQIITLYATIIGILVIFGIINGILYWQAFNKLSEKTNIETFKTTGLLFLIGSIIPLINWIGWIFAAKSYKQIQPQPTTPTTTNNTPTYTTTPPPNIDRIYCSQCGTENNTNTNYCKQCEHTLQTTQTNTTPT
ncbi:MAG: DUF996 domain-containing protein [Candidatus Bathyarchaeota archaeon]|nr:DUF996 domain-containing protein [Candidatus Termiticorpusculum sp.]